MPNYSEALKNKALELYVSDYTLESISKLEGMPTRQTLGIWKATYEWDKKKRQALELAGERLNINLAEIKERQLKIARATQGDYAKKLKAKPGDTNYGDADRAMKHELLLAGEATERVEEVTLSTIHEIYEKHKKKRREK